MNIIKYLNKLLPRVNKKSNQALFKNILVVSNTGFGDTLLSTPAIKTLRKNFENIHITFLVNKNFFPLFDEYKYVDNIITYKSGFINQLYLIKKLRDLKIDTVFLFHSNGPEDIFFSVLSGASNILKMTYNQNHEYKDLFLNKYVTKLQHDIENKLDLVRLYNPTLIDRKMEVSEKFNKRSGYFKDESKKYILLQLGAQDTYKMWPIDNYIALSEKLLKEYQEVEIVLLGSTAYEKELAITFMNQILHKERVINLCSKTSIDDLPNLLNSGELLITNDTGIMHLAIALKRKTICLFGPTNSKMFGPYQDLELHTVIQKDIDIDSSKFKKKYWTQETMKKITVQEVYNAINDIYKR
jgi:ADP-heptose:LPS heptosyltransferase